MKVSKLQVVQVSDVSIGYGNDDALAFMTSLVKHFQAEGIIIEPDQVDRPVKREQSGISIKRIGTAAPPRNWLGRIEFTVRAANEVNRLHPEILVIRCSVNIPILFKLNYRPRLTIYHATESVIYYSGMDAEIHKGAAPFIDLLVFPEENRAVKDVERCGFQNIPLAIAYNAVDSRVSNITITSPFNRNGKIIYFGGIDKNATFTDYYAHPDLQYIPIDLFGYIGGDIEGTSQILRRLQGTVKYQGYVDIDVLRTLRKKYSYSIVMWNPTNENQLYSAPCKFFESVADGIPPIIAPHPQPKMLIERYACGIVMRDWSFEAFRDALQEAIMLDGTATYHKMVENCQRAFAEELNWQAQFSKVQRLLPYVEPYHKRRSRPTK